MFNPRVTNFKAAPVNVSYVRGNISSDVDAISETIKSHFYNYCVSLIIPDCMSVPESIAAILTKDAEYYKCLSVPLHLLMSQDFIDYFVKGGEVSALSVNTCLDCNNCVAVTPCGNLVLSLDVRTYQQLGIINGPAVRIRQYRNSVVVIINLKENCFKIGYRNYDRLYRNIMENSLLDVDIILTWEPSDVKICPSSVAQYFSRHDVTVKECSVEESKRINYSVKFPLLSADTEDLFEWFGAMAFNAIESVPLGDFDYLFEEVEPYEEVGQMVFSSWTGLFSRKRMLEFFNEFIKLASKTEEVPWIGLSVLGYLDSPVCWGLRPHAYRVSGENDFCILLNQEGDFVMCKNTETCSER